MSEIYDHKNIINGITNIIEFLFQNIISDHFISFYYRKFLNLPKVRGG